MSKGKFIPNNQCKNSIENYIKMITGLGSLSLPGSPRLMFSFHTARDSAGLAWAPVWNPGLAPRLELPRAYPKSHSPAAVVVVVRRVHACDSQWRGKTEIHNENRPLSATDSPKMDAAPSCSECPRWIIRRGALEAPCPARAWSNAGLKGGDKVQLLQVFS